MLLIGSRAIRIHCPEFREAKDWDLIGTEAEIERLRSLLELYDEQAHKAVFHYQGGMLEVTSCARSEYWSFILAKFANEPTTQLPDIGEVAVAPLGFLLLTKHCGLIYPILHWHKNLEDLFFLKDRVASIPRDIAELVTRAVEDSRQMFASAHAELSQRSGACHPSLPPPPDAELHRILHERLATSSAPLVLDGDAWEGFPSLSGDEKRNPMMRLFAEEAMVVAATQMLMPKDANRLTDSSEGHFMRWALRTLMIGDLPVGWRYFGVNYYREIRAHIPDGWSHRIRDLYCKILQPMNACSSLSEACCVTTPVTSR